MAQTVSFSPADIEAQIQHWLSTEVDGYLGSTYGSPIRELLQNPFSAGLADAFLAKLRADVPLLTLLPANAVDLNYVNTGPDKQQIFISVMGRSIRIN
ncbi:hypothetical protein QYH69_07855 [Paraburkholderia sp. SARCC-3016]|uniref:hypothetical protein n=1 Tax=Paraburkholderia sp. SARCC-3016 TaxID=3058611 RepID=UPI0028069029|nr:hypothetical protein [Paraburkholderia sp. SARCC-3016]MDQ7977160.1 hypothetical protein [Paraburkholderia sp. SARCC-3016]